MSDVSSYDYSSFKEEVIKKNRYFLSEDAMEFLKRLTRKVKRLEINEGSVLYRSVVHDKPIDQDDYSLSVLEDRRMKPFDGMYSQESEGRVNPSNIHCLYLSSTQEGALAESRPEIGRPATVAGFATIRSLKIADLSIDPYPEPNMWSYFFEDTWQYSKAFSKPIMAFESRLGYVPTQIIAEFFKTQGFDGICYKSQFKHLDNNQDEVESLNFALFDLSAANIVEGSKQVYKITSQFIKAEKI